MSQSSGEGDASVAGVSSPREQSASSSEGTASASSPGGVAGESGDKKPAESRGKPRKGFLEHYVRAGAVARSVERCVRDERCVRFERCVRVERCVRFDICVRAERCVRVERFVMVAWSDPSMAHPTRAAAHEPL